MTDTDQRDVVVTRLIAAPREHVFAAFTDEQKLAQWWGPHGFTNPVSETDPRVGGTYRVTMRDKDGNDYPVQGVYREVTPPSRLVMTDDVSCMPETWVQQVCPGATRADLESLVTVSFDAEAGGTRLTVRTRFQTPAIRDAFANIGMIEGWTESLEKLEALLGVTRAA